MDIKEMVRLIDGAIEGDYELQEVKETVIEMDRLLNVAYNGLNRLTIADEDVDTYNETMQPLSAFLKRPAQVVDSDDPDDLSREILGDGDDDLNDDFDLEYDDIDEDEGMDIDDEFWDDDDDWDDQDPIGDDTPDHDDFDTTFHGNNWFGL